MLVALPQLVIAQDDSKAVRNLAEVGFKCQEAYYPAAARRSGADGRTRLRVDVSEEGRISSVSVVRPSGQSKEHKLLDQSAVMHVRSCAPKENSALEAVTFEYEVVWKLQ